MRSLPANIWRKVALPLALVICTSASAIPVFIGNDSSIDDSAVSDNDQIHQLVRILSGAYENSLMHDGSKADLKASDVLLETASIRFSSRALHELKDGSCHPQSQAGDVCALADPSLALSDWAEMLSHAAHRLDSLARSAPAADSSDNSRAVVTERMESMEHLYRMVFAVSKIYLDQSQSRAYLDAAQEQLKLARGHLEAERDLCDCDSSGYAGRLLELSGLNDQMNDMRYAAQP